MNKESRRILKSSSVLLIEDDGRVREKFNRLLSVYVNKVYEASNAETAFEIYNKNKPCFIIADIEMPDINGLDFIETLRKKNDKVPVIITSAHSNKEYLLFSIKLQLIDYLIKPIVQDKLLQALEEVAKIIKKTALLNIIKISDEIIYDPINKTVKVFNTLSRLTVSENKLLELLLLNRGNVVTKEMVEEKIYIFKEMSDTALKNIIYKLRKKLVKDVIKSVDKLGYTID